MSIMVGHDIDWILIGKVRLEIMLHFPPAINFIY